MTTPSTPARDAWLSVAAAVTTIILKAAAYWLTGSVGLLSDAVESLVNLVAAGMTLAMLTIAVRPPDRRHPFGHSKAEYFASGVEGALILLAALGIVASALPRLFAPQPLEQIGLGLAVAVVAALINLGVSLTLLRVGRQHRSIALEADAHHLLTDVWTTAGVVVGVGLVALTGWQRLDPIVALVVAGNIVWTGVGFLRKSVDGLMDSELPAADQAAMDTVLAPYRRQGFDFHDLRTRRAGAQRFVTFHLLVPPTWTIRQAHDLAERIEAELIAALPGLAVTSHIEPLDTPGAAADPQVEQPAASRPASAANHPPT